MTRTHTGVAVPDPRAVRPGRALSFIAVALLVAILFPGTLHAQLDPGLADEAAEPVSLPERLTPQTVDKILATMTDAQIRALVRAELATRAAAAETDNDFIPLQALRESILRHAQRISERLPVWLGEIVRPGARLPEVSERLGGARHGGLGMLLATVALVAAGVLTAAAAAALTRRWRLWLAAEARAYWDKVVRTVALGCLEFAPIIGFVAATRVAHAVLLEALGPLEAWVWIYHTGVSYAWLAVLLTRRAFAPDAPAIRVAPVSDGEAESIVSVTRRAAIIAAAGWAGAGLFPTLGFGFGPAILTVAAAGTAVALLFGTAVLQNRDEIRAATAAVFARAEGTGGALGTILVTAAPVVFLLYILVAWAYWLFLWLATGQPHVIGPGGTILVLFLAPIADRMGREAIGSAIPAGGPRTARIVEALSGSWRTLVILLSAFAVLDLWGLDVLALAHGPDAAGWARAVFDIAVTLFVGSVVWRLIRAALHTETRVAHGGEDADDPLGAGASRLDTLTPLFRTMLLGFIVIVVSMIALSALGVNIGPLLASAGIVGIAVGFGAQTLVRDIFSGIFFLVDDAFRVGEYIEVDAETRGEVEAISVRSLQLRHHRGPVITIPFGELQKVVNHNRDWVIYKMGFRLEPDTDPQKVKKVVKAVAKELAEHPEHGPKFIEPLKSQGVASIDEDSALVIRVKFKSRPRAQFVLRREVYHRLRTAFADAGIHFARRKVEVVSQYGKPLPAEVMEAAAETAEPQPAA